MLQTAGRSTLVVHSWYVYQVWFPHRFGHQTYAASHYFQESEEKKLSKRWTFLITYSGALWRVLGSTFRLGIVNLANWWVVTYYHLLWTEFDWLKYLNFYIGRLQNTRRDPVLQWLISACLCLGQWGSPTILEEFSPSSFPNNYAGVDVSLPTNLEEFRCQQKIYILFAYPTIISIIC